MLRDSVKEKIEFEIKEIDKLIKDAEPLLLLCKAKSPDFIELMAAATVLHSFYSGIEKIFLIIAKEVDKKLPEGQKWHKALIEQMRKNDNRERVISENLVEKLNEYLLFRHLFRHAYSFRLNWSDMKELVLDVEEVWKNVKYEVNTWIEQTEQLG